MRIVKSGKMQIPKCYHVKFDSGLRGKIFAAKRTEVSFLHSSVDPQLKIKMRELKSGKQYVPFNGKKLPGFSRVC